MQKSSLELFLLYLILLSPDDILSILKELEYMEKHPEEYPAYDNIEDLKKALLSDDE